MRDDPAEHDDGLARLEPHRDGPSVRGGANRREGLSVALRVEIEEPTATGRVVPVAQTGDDREIAGHDVAVERKMIPRPNVVGIGAPLAGWYERHAGHIVQDAEHPGRAVE